MSKIVKGTRDAKGVVTLRTSAGYGKIICPHCRSVATAVQNNMKGPQQYRCTGPCAATFSTKSM